MKAVTYLAAFTLGSAAIVGSAFGREPKGWITDLDRAFARAKEEKKNVLVDFTGSTWCPPCIEMREQVFSKKEFVDAAHARGIRAPLWGVGHPRDTLCGDEPLNTYLFTI